MAVFDLKNAVVKLQDGSTRTGAVNNASGYTTGTTMIVDGFTSAISAGETFTVVGDTAGTHTVISTVGGATPTSITFTPAITGTVADNAVITMGPRSLNIRLGDGTLTYDEKRAIDYVKYSGKLDTVKLGDEEPIDVKLDFTWVFLKSDTGETPTIEEVLKNYGNAASWVSSSADLCEPYAVDIVIVYTPPCSVTAGVKTEVITLQDYRYESLNHDAKAGQVSTAGKCNIKQASIARV